MVDIGDAEVMYSMDLAREKREILLTASLYNMFCMRFYVVRESSSIGVSCTVAGLIEHMIYVGHG